MLTVNSHMIAILLCKLPWIWLVVKSLHHAILAEPRAAVTVDAAEAVVAVVEIAPATTGVEDPTKMVVLSRPKSVKPKVRVHFVVMAFMPAPNVANGNQCVRKVYNLRLKKL